MSRHAIINTAVIVMAVGAGMALSIKPWQVYVEQKQTTEAQIAEMKSSEAKREQMVREEARLRSSIGREELARKQGWVGPGEVPVRQ